MPNFYAHLLFGREVSRRVSPELQRVLIREWDSYCCGNFGPDPLYFYVAGPRGARVRQAGIDLHHGSGKAAMEYFRKPLEQGMPYGVSFTSGYLLHYLLDSHMHPFVLETVAKGHVTHFALEGEFDRLLLRREGRDYRASIPQREFPPEFFTLASHMSPAVTPGNYQAALRRFRLVSFKMGEWAGTPFRYVVNAASKIPAAGAIRGSVLDHEPVPGLRRELQTMEQIFRETVEIAAVELDRFHQNIRDREPLSPELSRDYSGREV
jgi:hypothetical protein